MPIGSILGGMIGAGGASAAGNAAGAAGSQAYQNAQAEEAKNRAAISPWVDTGGGAVDELSRLYGLGALTNHSGGGMNYDPNQTGADRKNAQQDALSRFQTSPGYQFRFQQGVNALDRSAASRGMLLSGAQGQAQQGFGQDTASAEYGNYIGGLNSLSQQGESGVMKTADTNAGIFNAGNAAQMQGSMAQANGYQNSANALASGISKGVSSLGSIATFNPYRVFGNI